MGAEAGMQLTPHLWDSKALADILSGFQQLCSPCLISGMLQSSLETGVWLFQVFVATRDLVWQVFVKHLTRNGVIGPPSK